MQLRIQVERIERSGGTGFVCIDLRRHAGPRIPQVRRGRSRSYGAVRRLLVEGPVESTVTPKLTELTRRLAGSSGDLTRLDLKRSQTVELVAKRRLRILFVSSGLGLGGAERSLLDIVETLDAERFLALVAHPGGVAMSARLGEQGIPQVVCPHLGILRRSARLRSASMIVESNLSIAAIARRWTPDVIHGNTTTATLQASFCTAAPLVWHVRDFTLGWERYILWERAARVIVVAHELRRHLFGSNAEKATVISNGIRIEDFVSLPRNGAPAAHPRLLMVAHLARWKGHDVAIDMLRVLHERGCRATLLVLGGEGPSGNEMRADLLLRVENAKLSSYVRFKGDVDDVRPYLAASDLLVHAAYPEPFGRAVIEAMAARLPVVAFGGPHGPGELLAGGAGGVLVAERSSRALADTVQGLLADPARRSVLGHSGRARVVASFARESTTRRIEGEFERVVREAASRRRRSSRHTHA
jgi:glycosyltransferase involved in cell wall biosynthesis